MGMFTFNVRSNIAELQAQFAANKREMARAIRDGFRASKEPVREVLKQEARSAFKVRDPRMDRTWRVSTSRAPSLIVRNLMRGFGLHVTGGTIMPKRGRALLIPINTRGGTRIGTAKFYRMIDWLRREKLTFAKDGILYVKPLMNTSRRGGVAAGTRVNKKFRTKFQGTKKRPSGFEIKLNAEGLTPIAVIRRSVTLRKRFDMDSIARNKLIPIIIKNIANEIEVGRANLARAA